jgi:hypothetical protein
LPKIIQKSNLFCYFYQKLCKNLSFLRFLPQTTQKNYIFSMNPKKYRQSPTHIYKITYRIARIVISWMHCPQNRPYINVDRLWRLLAWSISLGSSISRLKSENYVKSKKSKKLAISKSIDLFRKQRPKQRKSKVFH